MFLVIPGLGYGYWPSGPSCSGAGESMVITKWVNGSLADTLTITVSDYTSTALPGPPPNIELYPNPNNGQLRVVCDQQISFKMRILDLGGKVVLREEFTGQVFVDTGALAPGTYMVVNESDKLIIRQKLIML